MTQIVYLAARYSRHPEMRVYRDILEDYGFNVNARWIEDNNHEMEYINGPSDFNLKCAREDFEDIREADVLVTFTEHPDEFSDRPTGGRHVELGWALALEKPVHVIGPRENVFYYYDGIRVWDNWASYLQSYVKPHYALSERMVRPT